MAIKPRIYQIKVTLNHTKPPIWRRFLIKSDVNLQELHDVLQTVMGWYDYHLYLFEKDHEEFSDPSRWDNDPGIKNAKKTLLSSLLRTPGSSLIYRYDMGDDWEHKLVLEEILESKPGEQYPVCIAGRRNCPPEDCGGAYGYAQMLAVLSDPNHEDYEEMREWTDEDWDPAEFDRDMINSILSE
jgi:hypothetical protein